MGKKRQILGLKICFLFFLIETEHCVLTANSFKHSLGLKNTLKPCQHKTSEIISAHYSSVGVRIKVKVGCVGNGLARLAKAQGSTMTAKMIFCHVCGSCRPYSPSVPTDGNVHMLCVSVFVHGC